MNTYQPPFPKISHKLLLPVFSISPQKSLLSLLFKSSAFVLLNCSRSALYFELATLQLNISYKPEVFILFIFVQENTKKFVNSFFIDIIL